MPTRVARGSIQSSNGTLRPPSDNMAFNLNDHRWSPWSERETPALVADKEALVMRQSAADAAARREETLLLMLGRQQEQLRHLATAADPVSGELILPDICARMMNQKAVRRRRRRRP